jgi:hypothetical protein
VVDLRTLFILECVGVGNMDRQEKKKLMKEWEEKQKKEFEDSLPIPKKIFQKLFDYLDEKSEESECNHNFDMTVKFLKENNCHVENVLEWLTEHGAGCDCEVLYNVEDFFE